mmetsp:Transcript_8461/g.14285  ORF Transcript_8461/g.14285 Transcript_8461/m.14285 type:complete len:225 (+) Transcript_8461:490-1164(+)
MCLRMTTSCRNVEVSPDLGDMEDTTDTAALFTRERTVFSLSFALRGDFGEGGVAADADELVLEIFASVAADGGGGAVAAATVVLREENSSCCRSQLLLCPRLQERPCLVQAYLHYLVVHCDLLISVVVHHVHDQLIASHFEEGDVEIDLHLLVDFSVHKHKVLGDGLPEDLVFLPHKQQHRDRQEHRHVDAGGSAFLVGGFDLGEDVQFLERRRALDVLIPCIL